MWGKHYVFIHYISDHSHLISDVLWRSRKDCHIIGRKKIPDFRTERKNKSFTNNLAIWLSILTPSTKPLNEQHNDGIWIKIPQNQNQQERERK